MNKNPLSLSVKQSVADLQNELDQLRRRLEISDRGKILFRMDLSYGDDDVLFVEADGFGGALLLIVEGNYPFDYLTREERVFSTEAEAMNAADAFRNPIVS